jgi:hypothetical protein
MLLDDEAQEPGQSLVAGKPRALQHVLELLPDSFTLHLYGWHL